MFGYDIMWNTCIQIIIGVLLCGSVYAAESETEALGVVLRLKPVGFWPLAGGKGDEIKDLSPTGNHGRAINLPWDPETGLLAFRNAFQYIEIPRNKAYQTDSFSCGGWVFLREKPVGGTWYPRMGFQVIGHHDKWQQSGAQFSIRRGCVPVASIGADSQYDALGNWNWSRGGPPRTGPDVLPLGSWQHVLFTYAQKGGRGRIYLNGNPVAARDGVAYKKKHVPLVAGNNASWWFQTINGATGLNGSLRDLVWFDRALTAAEAAMLADVTKPQSTPRAMKPGTVVVRTKWYEIDSLPDLPDDHRREVLNTLFSWEQEKLTAIENELLQLLPAELDNPDTRLPAAKLLHRLGGDAAKKSLTRHVDVCLSALNEKTLTESQRAEAALVLGQIGPDAASQARSHLIGMLEKGGWHHNNRPLGVENLLANACLIALSRITPDDKDVQKIIATVTTPLRSASGEDGSFLTRIPAKRGKDRDYIASATYQGVTYRVGDGIAWKGVEKVTPEQYTGIVKKLPVAYQKAARVWAKGKMDHLYRVPLYKTTPDGKTQKVYLEGETFVLYGEDAKLRGWSLFVDEKGYIHLVGGQHNMPKAACYIPGSWEQMGLSRKPGAPTVPRQMYWVSLKPERIDCFEFAGGRHDSRAIPTDYLNYMVFRKSYSGQNVLVGRIDHYGWQSWGAYLYDAAQQRWRALGGDAYNAYENALEGDPNWSDYAPRSNHGRVVPPLVRGGIPQKPTGAKALAWSWNPFFYNFCRDDWGIRFDRTGRMHVRVNLFGIQKEGFYHHSTLYAYSDDLGITFFRADGSSVKLPLTSNPAPAHNANVDRDANGQWLELWLEVLRLAGLEPTRET